jgi:hypothetical protein
MGNRFNNKKPPPVFPAGVFSECYGRPDILAEIEIYISPVAACDGAG